MPYDTCHRCGNVLDEFGQCFVCDCADDTSDNTQPCLDFSLAGDLELSLKVEGHEIKVDVAGIDVVSRSGDTFPARVWGFATPAQARLLAQRLDELADQAEAQAVQVVS